MSYLPAPRRLGALFPRLKLPTVELGHFPTAVEKLPFGDALFIKREDQAGDLYGGNKVRKLELLLGDAVARKKKRVITLGALGSHHALATTIYARRLGLEAELVLYPQPLDPHVIDDLLLDHVFGAKLHLARHPATASALGLALAAKGARTTAFIPPGGSSALGALGHVEGALELAEQVEKGELPEPDVLVCAFGTGGTVAGLALGLALAGLRTRVLAVRVVEAITTKALLRELLNGARRVLTRRGVPASKLPRNALERIEICPDQLGKGYGHATEGSRRAKEIFAGAGVTLETTYTGKAGAAFLELARKAPGRPLIFWHTFSSVDLAPRLSEADPEGLPRAFHRVLRQAGVLPPATS